MKKTYVLLLMLSILTHGADELSNKRKREDQAHTPEKRQRIGQTIISGNEELSEWQRDIIVQRLKEHSKLFKQCVDGCSKASDRAVYNVIMDFQIAVSDDGMSYNPTEDELTQEALMDSLEEFANHLGMREGLKIMECILRAAEDDSEEALKNSCNTYVQGLHKTDKEEKIIALLQAANYLDIPCMLDVCAKHAASCYDHQALKQFFEAPKVWKDKMSGLNIAFELQHRINAYLLQKYKNKLTPLSLERECHTDSVALAFSHNGAWLASAKRGMAGIWDTQTGKLLQNIDYGSDITDVAYNHNSTRLALGLDDGMVCIYDAATGNQLQQYNGHANCVRSVVYNHNGSRLASADVNGMVCLWDTETGNCLQKLYHYYNNHGTQVYSVAFNYDGSRLAAVSEDGVVSIWHAETGMCLQKLFHGKADGTLPVYSVAYNHDGSRLASGVYDGTVQIWDTETGVLLEELGSNGTLPVYSVVYSHDGSRLAAAHLDGMLRTWDAKTGEQLQQYGPLAYDSTDRYDYGWALAYNRDRLAFGSRRTVCIWKTPSYDKLIQQLDLIQALYVYGKLSKNQYHTSAVTEEQHFKELHDSLPDTIKQILAEKKGFL